MHHVRIMHCILHYSLPYKCSPHSSKNFFPPKGFPVSSCILSQTTDVINRSRGVSLVSTLGTQFGSDQWKQTIYQKFSMNLPWCIVLSCDIFGSTTRLLVTLTLGITFVCYPFLYDVFYTPNSVHVRIPHGCWFNNGVTISNLRCRDEIEGLLWARTQGCAAWHALVSRIASHDPLWSYTNVLSFRELFLGYLSLSCQKIFVLDPDVLLSGFGTLIVGYNLFDMFISFVNGFPTPSILTGFL
jgi:hypothetical protein